MPIKKKKGFTVEISSEVADILGVQKPDDLYMIINDNELILKPKKDVLSLCSEKRLFDGRRLSATIKILST